MRVHPSGRWVYVSNRGHDSIAQLAVNDDEGTEANEEDGNRADLREESSELYPMRPLTNNYMENSTATLEEGIDLQQQSENLINRIEGSLERIQRIRQRYAGGPITRAAGYNEAESSIGQQ